MGRRTLLLIASILVAAIGTGLILLWVRGADTRAQSDARPVFVVIAKKPINQGTSMSDARTAISFDVTSVAAKNRPANAFSRLADLASIASQRAVGHISVNTMITTDSFAGASEVTAPGLDKEHVAVELQLSDPLRVAGLVVPGSTVAVVVTGKDGTKAVSKYLLVKIQVLRVGSASQGSATSASTDIVPNQVLTLLVSYRQALAIRFAEGNGGTLSLVYQGDANIPLNAPVVDSFQPVPSSTPSSTP